jgi:uncharacterized protein YyaL (SSP411 family)
LDSSNASITVAAVVAGVKRVNPTHTNRLINETSPYLMQHAHNPVDWWPWCKEALQLARQQNKLILLSVGYSACHWCHVMAHESFEDKDTAALMNKLFINIKVDREERPDLDKIYQTAHQLLAQRPGGWPLTVILTPDDQTPFFAGTYFPVKPRYNMPAFSDVLQRVHDFYQQNENDILEQNRSLTNALQRSLEKQNTTALDSAPIDQARRQLEQHYDQQHTGFGKAPKFPHPTNLERLLYHWSSTRAHDNEDTHAFSMLDQTLSAMARGGLFDQLGGGFFRYSVDDIWMIPHFEKMLYDNGPLLGLYSLAHVATGNEFYRQVANETAQWVMREMQSNQGAYFSTLDADSEGEEGKFYVWQPGEVKDLLTKNEFEVLSRVYGLDRTANFEGHWHLHTFTDFAQTAQRLSLAEQQVQDLLNSARQKLFTAREQRVHPGRDEKILTSWNGLMIKGMAITARYLHEEHYLQSAQQAVDFIRDNMLDGDRLFATYKDGQARLMAYLDDYAFLLDAVIELLQARWRTADLQLAIQLADALLQHFEDKQNGGFYFTAHDHEALFHRPKPLADEAIPAGNAIACLALARLGHLLGETRYLDASERALQYAMFSITQAPYAHAAFLHALEEYLYPPELIVIRGATGDIAPWQEQLDKHFVAHRLVFAIPNTETKLPGLLAQRHGDTDKTIAYCCTGTQCHSPITQLNELASYKTP